LQKGLFDSGASGSADTATLPSLFAIEPFPPRRSASGAGIYFRR